MSIVKCTTIEMEDVKCFTTIGMDETVTNQSSDWESQDSIEGQPLSVAMQERQYTDSNPLLISS